MSKGVWRIFRRHAREVTQDDYETRRARRGYSDDGQEMDPVPVAPPIGYKRQPSMADHVREMVKSELLRREVEAAGAETFEEADDFGEEDEDERVPLSGYESDFDPPAVQEAYKRPKKSKEGPTQEESPLPPQEPDKSSE